MENKQQTIIQSFNHSVKPHGEKEKEKRRNVETGKRLQQSPQQLPPRHHPLEHQRVLHAFRGELRLFAVLRLLRLPQHFPVDPVPRLHFRGFLEGPRVERLPPLQIRGFLLPSPFPRGSERFSQRRAARQRPAGIQHILLPAGIRGFFVFPRGGSSFWRGLHVTRNPQIPTGIGFAWEAIR